MSAEDVMQEKSEDAEDENGASVLCPDRSEFCLPGHVISKLKLKRYSGQSQVRIWMRFRISEKFGGVNVMRASDLKACFNPEFAEKKSGENPVGGFAD